MMQLLGPFCLFVYLFVCLFACLLVCVCVGGWVGITTVGPEIFEAGIMGASVVTRSAPTKGC